MINQNIDELTNFQEHFPHATLCKKLIKKAIEI